MKLDKERLEHSINICIQCILSKQQFVEIKNKRYLVWPLFFLESMQPREDGVDICATALGVTSCSYFIGENINDEISSAVREGISTLLFVRNADGSWPSKISLVTKDDVSMEGVISDTYFALNALLNIGFIANNPKISGLIDPQNNKVLDSLNDRLEIVEKGIEWLLSNRVGQGWGYTGIKYLEDRNGRNVIPAYVVPSINAVIIMSKILCVEKEINPHSGLIERIDSAINETVGWICKIQNSDGGFGIKRGEKSRVGNTAKVIIALCSLSLQNSMEQKVNSVVDKAIRFVLKHYSPKKVDFESVSEDYSQFIVQTSSDGEVNAFKRTILHELYLEPLVLESLSLYYMKNLSITISNASRRTITLKNKIYKTIRAACEDMLEKQKVDGELQGAIRGRRPAQFEGYTIYACSDLICTFSSLINNNELSVNVIKLALKQRIMTGICVLFIIFILLPVMLSNEPWWLSLILLVISPIALNIISSIIEKMFLKSD